MYVSICKGVCMHISTETDVIVYLKRHTDSHNPICVYSPTY